MRGQMGGALLCSSNVMQLYYCQLISHSVSWSFLQTGSGNFFSAYSPLCVQQFSFRPQLSLVVVMAVGRLGTCPSLSPFYTKLSVSLSVFANWQKIAVLLRVELTLAPLFAPPESLSFLPFALCHQSPTVSKNSGIVIVTDSPRSSEPPPRRTQEAGLSCLIYLFSLFVLASVYNWYKYCSSSCSHLACCWFSIIYAIVGGKTCLKKRA